MTNNRDDTEIAEANARMSRRMIMARVAMVEHELDMINGEIEDLPKPRDVEIDAQLRAVVLAASALRELLVRRDWR